MKTNHKVTFAVLMALGAARGGMVHAVDVGTDTESGATLGEVVVTAQRRTESIQDVPITIQALTGDQLKQLQVETFDDVIKLLPNVTFGSNGPGQGEIFMRGLSAGTTGNQSSATIAPFPNVAVYLDDQSMQFPARNVDVYLVDIERVEVLEGPQGTLFGGGAEAGAIRYITNKPKLDKTEGNAEASYGWTAGGDPNTSVNATLNVPIIDGTLAIRAVVYDDRRGGYINNVPSTFTRNNTDLGNFYANIKPTGGLCPNGLPTGSLGYCAVPNSLIGNNFALAGRATNPTEYQGFRASVLYKITEDWDLLIAQSFQDLNAEGSDAQFPIGSEGQVLGPDQTTQFTPAFNKDQYENTAWTLDGKIADLRLVYAGGYLNRNIDTQQDYTNYTRSVGGWYYSCTGGTGLGAGTTPRCYSPVTSWRDRVHNTHQSHEIRLSTPDDWRIRAIGGAFYENFQIHDNMNFNYKTIPSCNPTNLAAALAPGGAPCVANVTTAPGSTAISPGQRGDATAFGEDAQRGYQQYALFASLDFDIIPKVLTITGGTRWYHYLEFETGSQYGTTPGCVNVPNGQCKGGVVNINGENLDTGYHGFRSRGNISWHITPDTMVYYTFSQGFRPGAFNRTVSAVAKGLGNIAQYEKPHGYGPDSLTNHEIGLKTEVFDHRLQFDASAYYMLWNNVQFLFFNPAALGNTTFGVNGPDYKIKGVELQITARPFEGLTLQGSGSWNHATQSNSPCLVSNIATSPTNGQCITQVVQPGQGLQPFQNPYGSVGSVPAFSPPFEFNVRARYDFTLNDYKPYVMVGMTHIDHMFNQPATYQAGDVPKERIPTTTRLRYEQPGYETYDASVGVSKDKWNASIYGSNLSNSNASTFTSSAQFIKSEVPLRPRVVGFKIGYQF